MRVKIEVTLDVDPEAWAQEYGIPANRVREDVKEWAAQTLAAHLDVLCLREGV